MDKITMTLPLSGEYLTTVRLTVGGLCALKEFDVDLSEDYKVGVTESLLILKRNGFSRVFVEFTMGEALGFSAEGLDRGQAAEDSDAEISYALLNALIGNVDFEKDESGKVHKISFEG